VPFLRPCDLPQIEAPQASPPVLSGVEGGDEPGARDPLIEGVRQIYADAVACARARRAPGQAIVALGHLYMQNARLSEMSERKVLGGNLHALPVDIFGDEVTYAALGHLHATQAVGGREAVRYCGSPIPLAFSEADYRHAVLVVDLEGDRLAAVRALEVPRAVPLLRLPEEGPRPLADVLARLAALPGRAPGAAHEPAHLEARVALAAPEPALRAKLEKALAGKDARLLLITTRADGDGFALADARPAATLADLQPEQVFRRAFARRFPGEPPQALLEAFDEACDLARREPAPRTAPRPPAAAPIIAPSAGETAA
jgi:exonuclease SbcD